VQRDYATGTAEAITYFTGVEIEKLQKKIVE